MARRMTLEGAKVKAVCELMPYSGGLARNMKQCLEDFDIPLLLSHTVVEIHGKDRVSGVTIAKVDENRKPLEETRQYISCDTLLLSVGLIPENELSKCAGIGLDRITNGAVVDQDRATEIDGIFACGNVLHVHDLVDYVSEEGERAGASAARFLRNHAQEREEIAVTAGIGVRYVVPQAIHAAGGDVSLSLRVARPFAGAKLVVRSRENVLVALKRPKMAPGEMEKITLRKEQLQGVAGMIRVEVEGAE